MMMMDDEDDDEERGFMFALNLHIGLVADAISFLSPHFSFIHKI